MNSLSILLPTPDQSSPETVYPGHSEICRVLLEVSVGPHVNLPTYGKAWTPLMFACFHDHIHVAVLLIAHGADHKIKNSEKKTAFQYVTDKDKLQLLTDLVSTGMYTSIKS